MGSLFRKKPASLEEIPAPLLERCLAYPESTEVFEEMARHFGAEGRALADFYRERSKEDPRHRLGLARAYVRLGKPSLALVQYKALEEAGPLSPLVREELAQVFEKLDKPELARQLRATR